VEEELVAPLLAACGVADLDSLAAECSRRRVLVARSATRWAPACLLAALQLAVRGRGWPAHLAPAALLLLAADPGTGSPMRLAEAGPWWDTPDPAAHAAGGVPAAEQVAAWERRLDDTDGHRPALQAAARRELAAEGLPLTRATVARRAVEVLDRATSSPPAAGQPAAPAPHRPAMSWKEPVHA
jgi:hypothetical protein